MKTFLIIIFAAFLSGCARPNLETPVKIISIEQHPSIVIIKYRYSLDRNSSSTEEFRVPSSWAGRFEVGKEYYIKLEEVEPKMEKE
jgi:type IV pilus biogenesis protein CpaD/CtpE